MSSIGSSESFNAAVLDQMKLSNEIGRARLNQYVPSTTSLASTSNLISQKIYEIQEVDQKHWINSSVIS